ncbi:MAG: ribose-phosphate pyrophosphokinase [Alphaproteobacteria bacterium]|nr:ribose-phosphate pyrophosphokinase [Alphaproteobacteria bacterium]MCD8570771.1 ribose-phosphate pyrophosphokinase [Alphaproteobacteria bacterium]
MKLIAGNSNLTLAREIADYLGTPLTDATLKKFSDKEIFVEINENVRGQDVFFIQSTSYPANDHLMELLIAIDALKRGSARRITAVIPYFGYARQDRKTGSRAPITAKLVANLLEAAGVHRILTMELHAGQIQGFFDVPVDNLISAPVFIPNMQQKFNGAPLCIVSPDVGGVVRARALAKRCEADLAIIDKRREKAGVSEVMHVIGDVKDKVCILVDDIVDSGGTLCNAAQALADKGAKEVYAYVVHGVLSGEAIARVEKSPMKKLVLTNSIEATEGVNASDCIEQLSVASLIGEAIRRTHEERSISELFL